MRRRIRNLGLKHLNQSGKFPSGNPRLYYRPKGQKGIPLPDLPMNSPGFLSAYVEAAGEAKRQPVLAGTLAKAVELYKGSEDFLALSTGTRGTRQRMLDEISEKYGCADIKELRARHIEKDLSRFSGHARNNHLKMWRAFSKWIQHHYSLEFDPSDGVKRSPTPKSEGHLPWGHEHIQQFRSFWPFGSMERLAFELLYWTGARVSDAIRLGEKDVDADGWLLFHQQKTGGRVDIPFNRELPDFAECLAEDLEFLHRAIAEMPERHLTWLHTRGGSSRSSKSISQWFAAKTRMAGIEGRSAHGLRKSRAIALTEAGGTSPQIGAWTGHETLQEIERYIRKFNKRRVLSKTKPEQKGPTFPKKFQKPEKRSGKSNG